MITDQGQNSQLNFHKEELGNLGSMFTTHKERNFTQIFERKTLVWRAQSMMIIWWLLERWSETQAGIEDCSGQSDVTENEKKMSKSKSFEITVDRKESRSIKSWKNNRNGQNLSA